MKYYQYRQNNSGGFMDGPEHIFIQAKSAAEADEIAVNDHGVYFNGCASGQDCSCCGDRWYPTRDGDEYDRVEPEDRNNPNIRVVDHPDAIASSDEMRIAADLLEEAGFDRIADYLRNSMS